MIWTSPHPAVDWGARPPAARRCVVFDFDGTLADTGPSIIAVAREVLLDFGLSEEELAPVAELIGPPFPQAFTQVFGLSAADAQMVTDRYREIYGRLGAEAWPVAAGVEDMLSALKAAGRTLCVASSKREALLRRCVEDGGLAGYFDAIEGKHGDGPASKADTIADAIAQAGCSAADAVMVGDRRYDVEAAAQAGLPAIGARWCHTAKPGELEDAGAAIVADEPSELAEVLLGPDGRGR